MKKYITLTIGILLFFISSSFAFAVEIPSGGYDYNNNKHGFYLVLPSGWADYYVEEEEFSDATIFTFFLPTTDTSGDYLDGAFDMFTITASFESNMEMLDYLGENSTYTFYFSHFNGFPPDDLTDQVLDFDQITSTFTAFEPTGQPGLDAFSDIDGHQYEVAINFVKENEVVEGYSDGTYRPDNPVNRAEFTKILMGQLYEESSIVGSNCFPDVGTEWFAKYVCSAKSLGVIQGYPDGEFEPSNNINLAESLKIIVEFSAELNNETVTPVEGPWYQVYFDIANMRNMLSTINSDPAHFLTRGEMAELMYRMSLI